MMDDRTFWGWGVRGLGGAVHILSMLADESRPIHPEHLDQLKQQAEKLVDVIGKAEKRQSEPS